MTITRNRIAKQAPEAKDYTPTWVQSRRNVSEKFAIKIHLTFVSKLTRHKFCDTLRYTYTLIEEVSMSADGIVKFLKDNPKYRDILRRAIEAEEKNAENQVYLGWEWHHVRAYPAQLVKLVIAGITNVNFKSNSATCYLLVDREATKQALKAY